MRYLKNVSTLTIDRKKCTGCGMCAVVCPHRVIKVAERKAWIIEPDLCMECGACAVNCRENAVSVKSGTGCAYGMILAKLKGSSEECECECG